jgi:hypothetical protein
LCYLLGVCHDFGKATSYFQGYIKAIRDGKIPKKRAESNHGGISALFASSVVRSRFSHLESPLRDILPYIAYEAAGESMATSIKSGGYRVTQG